MKTLQSLGLVLILTGCALLDNRENLACPRISPEGQDLYWGDVNALRNDELWPNAPRNTFLYAVLNPEREVLDFLIDVSISGQSYQEHLFFSGIPNKEGSYTLPQETRPNKEQRWFFFAVIGGDALAASYTLDSSALINQVTIDSIDKSNCNIEGSFELTLLREQPGRNRLAYPDTIRFSKGEFRTHLVQFD